MRQVCEYLTYTGYNNITVPWLLDKWAASADVKEWTLFLKKGIKFNDGQEFTADDVVFNIGQWLDPRHRILDAGPDELPAAGQC